MDRRSFMKKVGKLAGISVAGVSLSKLQIATVATGLSGLLGCSRDPVEDPAASGSALAPSNIQGECMGTTFTCPPTAAFDCDDGSYYVCQSIFNCACAGFDCDSKHDCNTANICTGVFDCRDLFECPAGGGHDCPLDFDCPTAFGTPPCALPHDQGGGG